MSPTGKPDLALELSPTKTLARKYRITVPQVYRHYRAVLATEHGPRRGLQVVVERDRGRLARDPPIDWTAVKSQEDFLPFTERDTTIASAMENEVLSKRHKALMLFGLAHMTHGGGAVGIYEQHYSNTTFVIADHRGFAKDNDQLEKRMTSWPVPSLAPVKIRVRRCLPLCGPTRCADAPAHIIQNRPRPGLHRRTRTPGRHSRGLA